MPHKNLNSSFTLLLGTLLTLCGFATSLCGDAITSERDLLLESFQEKLAANDTTEDTKSLQQRVLLADRFQQKLTAVEQADSSEVTQQRTSLAQRFQQSLATSEMATNTEKVAEEIAPEETPIELTLSDDSIEEVVDPIVITAPEVEVATDIVDAAAEEATEEVAAETEVSTAAEETTEEVATEIVLTLPEETTDEKEQIDGSASELSEVTLPSTSSLSTDGDDEMVYLLDDFVVSAEDDQGYYSANTLAGTRTNELTKNIPMTISTVNQEMIQDFGLQTLADLGNYVPSIESEDNGYNNSAIRFRGFVARNALFEFMPRYSPLDYYMVERADVIRGANSLIYGQADPGGKINTISKMANMSKNETTFNVEFGDHSHTKYQLDTNVVLNDSAAVRVMAVDSYKEFTQDHRFQKFQGIALESTYTPTQKTRLRFHVDTGQADRSIISSTFTMQGGPTGLPRGIVADPKLADLVEDDFLDYLVNYNDGTLRALSPTLTDTAISQNGGRGTLVPDYITDRDSLRELFTGITPQNTGTAFGPDATNTRDSVFALGEVSHRFSDELELKVAVAYENVDGLTLNPGGSSNGLQHSLSTGISYKIPNLDYDSTAFSATASQDFYDLSFASEINDVFDSNDLTQIEANIRSAISGYSIGGRLNRLRWEDHADTLYDIYSTNDAATIDTAISGAVDAWVLAQSSSNANNQLRVTRAQALADKAFADAQAFAESNPDSEAAQQAFQNFDATANGYLSNLISNQYSDASASEVTMKQAWGNIALDLQSASAQVKAAIDAAEGTDELHPYDAAFGNGDNPAADTNVWAVGNQAVSLDTYIYDAFSNLPSSPTILRPYAAENYTLDQIADIIIDAYVQDGNYTIESINAAHGHVQDQLKYLNPNYDLGAELWTVGNAAQSIDQLVYDVFNGLDTENDISRPRNSLGRQAWALQQYIDLDTLNAQISQLGVDGLTAILATNGAIPTWMGTSNGGTIAYPEVDTNGNKLVDTSERTAQQRAIAEDIAQRLVAGAGGSGAELWSAIRGIEDLFSFYLHPENDVKWMWTGTIFPALISNVGALTTNPISSSGEINPSLYSTNNEILVPFTRSLWTRSFTKDENTSARITLNYTPDSSFLPGKQQLLFGLDLDRREASQRREEQFQEGSLVYGNGVALNRDTAYNYAVFSEILNANFVRRFDMNQDGYNLPGGAENALVTLRNLPVNPDNQTVFYETYSAETSVDTTGLWVAASGSYNDGRLRTLIGGRVDTIKIESKFQDYKIRELPRGFEEGTGDLKTPEPNTSDITTVKYDGWDFGFPLTERDDDSTNAFLTPSVGGLFWMTEELAIFANYSKSVISPTGFQYDVFGVLTPPETGEGREFGLKYSSADGKINAQVMAFSIDKKNDQRSNLSYPQMQAAFPASDPANAAIWDIEIVRDQDGAPIFATDIAGNILTNDDGQPIVRRRESFDPLGSRVANEEIRSQGLELDFYYNPINQLSIFLGYAYLDTKILNSSLPILEGLELPGTAAHNVNMTVRYSFPYSGKLKGCFISVNQKFRSGALLDNYFTDLDYDGDQDYFATTINQGLNTEEIRQPEYYSLRLEDQMITDLSIGWNGRLGPERDAPRARVQLTINNLFNALDLYSTGTNRARYTDETTYRISAGLTF